MIKKYYVFAWLLLVGTALAAAVNGTFGATELIVTAVGAVGLVYAFALWAVIREPEMVEGTR